MKETILILLALNPSSFLELGQRALHGAGYETAVVHDRLGLERVLHEITPNLLLIGENLNGESGWQLAAEQRERFPTLPILIYVEKESLEIAKQTLRLGLNGYLCPPLRTDEIVEAIQRSLKQANRLGDWVRREVRRSTAALQRQLEDFQAVFRHLADGIILLDPKGRILLVNPAAEQAFSIRQDQVLGKPIVEAIPHPDLQAMLARPHSNEVSYHEINLDDGRAFSAHLAVVPHVGSAITLQDISYLKELDRIKTDFVHTISHDLRSPLTSVLGYAELIGRTGPLNEHQREFMNRLQTSIRQVTALINDLLDLGRLEAGLDTRCEVVQLKDIVEYVLDMLRPQIEARQQKVDFEAGSTLPPLRANPLRLRQMVDNLLNNAIKYTPQGGKIGVRLRAKNGQVILEVSDTGPGIPPADQPHIFEKFYRARNVPEDLPGSGLGLAIVKAIVDNYQGRVWVESTPGKGTTFFVVLPAHVSNPQVQGDSTQRAE